MCIKSSYTALEHLKREIHRQVIVVVCLINDQQTNYKITQMVVIIVCARARVCVGLCVSGRRRDKECYQFPAAVSS